MTTYGRYRRFRDRHHAGVELAGRLKYLAGKKDVCVLGLPRGGVPVADEIARALGAPLDVFVVRKLGTPGRPELAMGAIASGGIRILNDDVVKALRIDAAAIAEVTERETRELERREHAYRDERPPVRVQGKTVILVDDGVATGATMHAAVLALKQQKPSRLIVAVPHSSSEACRTIETIADEVVCLETPEPYFAVGAWYEDFRATTDDEVQVILRQAAGWQQEKAESHEQ